MIRNLLWLFSCIILGLGQPIAASTNADDTNVNKLRPIEANPEFSDPSFIALRCASFAEALKIYSIILGNPFIFPEDSVGTSLDWLGELWASEAFRSDVSKLSAEQTSEITSRYLKEFGTIQYPSPIPEMGLFRADKVTCLRAYTDWGNQSD